MDDDEQQVWEPWLDRGQQLIDGARPINLARLIEDAIAEDERWLVRARGVLASTEGDTCTMREQIEAVQRDVDRMRSL